MEVNTDKHWTEEIHDVIRATVRDELAQVIPTDKYEKEGAVHQGAIALHDLEKGEPVPFGELTTVQRTDGTIRYEMILNGQVYRGVLLPKVNE